MEIIAVVGIAAFFAVIAYAGYKVVKKWSGSQPDWQVYALSIFLLSTITQTETANPETASGTATLGTYLKVSSKIHGSAAATPIVTVKTAMPRWRLSQNPQVKINREMGVKTKKATDAR